MTSASTSSPSSCYTKDSRNHAQLHLLHYLVFTICRHGCDGFMISTLKTHLCDYAWSYAWPSLIKVDQVCSTTWSKFFVWPKRWQVRKRPLTTLPLYMTKTNRHCSSIFHIFQNPSMATRLFGKGTFWLPTLERAQCWGRAKFHKAMVVLLDGNSLGDVAIHQCTVTVNLGTRLLWEVYDNLEELSDANEKLKTTVYGLNSFYELNQICNELDKWQMSKMFPK